MGRTSQTPGQRGSALKGVSTVESGGTLRSTPLSCVEPVAFGEGPGLSLRDQLRIPIEVEAIVGRVALGA